MEEGLPEGVRIEIRECPYHLDTGGCVFKPPYQERCGASPCRIPAYVDEDGEIVVLEK
jgi:hypothetical protein